MRTYLDCLPCFLRQALSTARRFTDSEPIQERVIRDVLHLLAEVELGTPAPRVAQRVYPTIYAALGHPDPYLEVKRECTERALALLPGLERRVAASRDPFRAAVKLALAGNIIDFGIVAPFDLDATIERVLDEEPRFDEIERLERIAARAGQILFLADNAGELVLDRPLLGQLLERAEVTVAVRGGPTINDVTREDVGPSGLDPRLRVIAPEAVLPGIWLEGSGAAFRRAFDEADLVLSKGQGNFETLYGELDHPALAFVFMVKCHVVADLTGLRRGDAVAGFQDSLQHHGMGQREPGPLP